jgi:hypothetical protein
MLLPVTISRSASLALLPVALPRSLASSSAITMAGTSSSATSAGRNPSGFAPITSRKPSAAMKVTADTDP